MKTVVAVLAILVVSSSALAYPPARLNSKNTTQYDAESCTVESTERANGSCNCTGDGGKVKFQGVSCFTVRCDQWAPKYKPATCPTPYSCTYYNTERLEAEV